MNAFLFVPLLAMTWIFGLFLAMIASHYFLSVLESSGQGNDEVSMPEEPFVDWVGKVVYLGFFVILWGIPSLIMMAATKGMDPLPRFLLIALPFWLVFPVGILSPLCLQSRWVPFWPGLLHRMTQKAGATFQLYFLSLPVVSLMCYAFWQLTQSETAFPLIFLYAILTAVCFLLYARLLGRYGFVLTFTRGLETEKVKKKRPRPRPRPVEEEAVFVQPTEMEGVHDPFGEEVTGYGVNLGKKIEEAKVPPPVIDDEESYIVEEGLEIEEPVVGSQPTQSEQSRAFAPPREEEVRLFIKNRKVKEPKTPFGPETVLFLAGPDMMTGLIKLAGGFALFSLLIHFMAATRPI
jgi:hypothetical protein